MAATPIEPPNPAATGVLTSAAAGPLSGTEPVPGDKSISHRALMLGALAVGETGIEGLLESEDVLATAAAMRRLGATVERGDDGVWQVGGAGLGGLGEPDDMLDMGNAGTGARLLMGMLATHPLTAVVTGDASLRRRPMGRVMEPLSRFGARFVGAAGDRLPLAVIGAAEPVPITYRLPVPSAQVKSAVLLAGLNTPGETSVVEPWPTRDHTERLLRHFGADPRVEASEDGGKRITLGGQPELAGCRVRVPGDLSSAAVAMVAACLVADSEITLRGVGMNPLRTGIVDTLREMGADITLADERCQAGEPVAHVTVRSAPLNGVDVPAERAPRMIDEYPILAVAAACARGTTRLMGLAELRVKESDRLAAIAAGLHANGVAAEAGPDSLTIEGAGGPAPGGGAVETRLDHRIAMSFLVLGMAARAPVTIDDGAPIASSFPGFIELMNRLGARIRSSNGNP
ncbi:MAG: 3-phosphoshikimate 1-carboxyvinyltransferase [Kiloniellales bacterium]